MVIERPGSLLYLPLQPAQMLRDRLEWEVRQHGLVAKAPALLVAQYNDLACCFRELLPSHPLSARLRILPSYGRAFESAGTTNARLLAAIGHVADACDACAAETAAALLAREPATVEEAGDR